MTDNMESSGSLSDDMAEYLQIFLDETEEQLDDLVETMLALERDSTSKDDLNEAFRLVHSVKGSAGMMGLHNIAALTHQLESRFERFRSGQARLDEPTMNLVLRCIDYLRQCNNNLRDGEQLGSPAELLDDLNQLEEQAAGTDARASRLTDQQDSEDLLVRIVVRFRDGLLLADLKAQLIVTRLSELGDVKSTHPDLDHLPEAEQLDEFEITMVAQADVDRLRATADVDGVESIDIASLSAEPTTQGPAKSADDQAAVTDRPTMPERETERSGESTAHEVPSASSDAAPPERASTEIPAGAQPEPTVKSMEVVSELPEDIPSAGSSTTEKAATKVAETMRVDIDRLNNLMNLTGELVVNRARFVQISGQISPALRKASMLNRIRDFRESLRSTIGDLEHADDVSGDWSTQIKQLRAGLDLMDEQSEIWDNGRHCFKEIGEAIDQLTRVSHSLQRGVLDTRMVAVGPLFNRFKRVVRDLSMERGKKVNLLIRGEKTELDKRMIDELGDPLVHLVRNSIDHGLEPPDVRVSRGKPESGSIFLEASHSGNNVYIHVRDDGGGVDVERIKAKLIDNRVLSSSAVDELSDEQALDYIWHPGFSTAKEVTNVSGRGVGMDAVKTRINQLNGTIDVESTPQRGTTFTIRLPLTLAIINSLLVHLRNVIVSIPMDDVREIVSLNERDIVTVHGKQTFEVRGEFIPLVRIDEVFRWHAVNYGYDRAAEASHIDSSKETVDVVILHARGRTLGLRVDELLGSQDIVIKSLSENFIDIRGLSGASILGDGSVCLMLDVGTVIDMTTKSSQSAAAEDMAS